MIRYCRKAEDTVLGRDLRIEVFDSAKEFVETIDKRMKSPRVLQPRDSDTEKRILVGPDAVAGKTFHESWLGHCSTIRGWHCDKAHPFKSWEQDKWAILHGSKKDVAKLGMDKKVLLNPEFKKTFKRDYCGAFPCVPAYLAGKPKSMYRPVREREASGKVATVIISIGMNSGASSNEVSVRMREAFQKVVAMESQGIRTNLYVAAYFLGLDGNAPEDSLLMVKLKDSSSVFSPTRVSWALSASAMFRVYGFNWQATSPDFPTPFGRGWALRRKYSYYHEDKSWLEKQLYEFNPPFFKKLGNYVAINGGEE